VKIQLQITTKGGKTTTFVHPGPTIRIGRDPECELVLEDEAADTVSRQHACIELAPNGATVRDLGSSNGTRLNGQPVNEPVPMRAGDAVQLGFTGAVLKVTQLELAPDLVPIKDAPAANRWLIPAAAAVVVLGTIVAIVIVLIKKPESQVAGNEKPSSNPPLAPVNKPPSTPTQVQQNERAGNVPKPEDNKVAPKEAVPDALKSEPNKELATEEKELGVYNQLKDWPPSVLLERSWAGWARLAVGDKISSSHTLVSLPGYQSTLALKSGIDLTLWGTTPDFPGTPSFESAVQLGDAADVDLDLQLNRGRILLVNRKPSGKATVRVRFLKETWQLELSEPGTEAAVELTTPLATAADQRPELSVQVSLLAIRGSVRLETGQKPILLGEHQQVTWTNAKGSWLHPDTLRELPPWRTKGPDLKNPEVLLAVASLKDWAKLLSASTTGSAADWPIDRIRARVRDPGTTNPDAPLGVLFLAALDLVDPLVDSLYDPRPSVRGTAIFCLRRWMSRAPHHAEEFTHSLQKKGYNKEKAKLILSLMYAIPPAALQPAKISELVGLLDNEDLVVRDLALMHLQVAAESGKLPEKALKLQFEPTDDEAKRKEMVKQWKELLSSVGIR
jgi:pSer/pThr/pTyr-binding forkhead associated (FHA) protein